MTPAPDHGHGGAAAPGAWGALLGCLLVTGTLAGAGYPLLQPFLAPASRRERLAVAGAVSAAATGLVLLPGPGPAPATVAAAVTLVVPVFVLGARPAALAVVARFAGWPLAAAAFAAVPLVTGAYLATWDPPRQAEYLRSGLLAGLTALGWLTVCLPRRRRYRVLAGVIGASLAVALIAAAATVAVPGAAFPQRPGLPVAAGDARVLVIPGRDGRALVHATAGGTRIGTRPDALVTPSPRPGTTGDWAEVRLPAGHGTLWAERNGQWTSVPVTTGAPTFAPDLRGPDAAECAGAWLGTVLAGTPGDPVCPADRLRAPDAAALRAALGFLAGRGDHAFTLVADGSPRSAAAEAVVRATAARLGLTVAAPDRPLGPLVVVAGWGRAEAVLRDVAAGRLPGRGSYLAPWLMTPPLLEIPAGQLLPLDFSPAGPDALGYLSALGADYAGETPSSSGLAAWSGAEHRGPAPPVRIYAVSRINVDFTAAGTAAHRHGSSGGWLPGGAVTAVSGPLAAP
ncbi:DUF6239 family natural product biosynthesis protein [Amycolatopsis sp. NPDC005003]